MKRSEEIFRKVLDRDKRLIENTRKRMNPAIFDRACDMISHARDIYIIGVRSCAPLAEYLGYYLNQIFDHVTVVRTSSAAEIFEQLLHLKEKDLVIGISFPRYSLRVLKALEYANTKNAGIITMTDSINSPICLYSSCNLLSDTALSSIVDSMTAPMSVINAFVTALCAKNRKALMKNLEELDMIWHDYPVGTEDEMDPLDPDIRVKKEEE